MTFENMTFNFILSQNCTAKTGTVDRKIELNSRISLAGQTFITLLKGIIPSKLF